MKEINKRLIEARIRAGFETATLAAEAMGMPYQTYATHENGSGGVPVKPAIKYAKKFKVSLDWLLTGKGRGPSPENQRAWEISQMIYDLTDAEDLDYVKQAVEFARKKSGKAA